MKKSIVVFCVIIIFFSSCTFEQSTITDNLYEKITLENCSLYEDFSSLPQEIQDIIYNNGTFFDVESQKQYTKKSYKVTDNEELNQQIQWSEYMVFDFDDDGEKELVVMLDVGGGDPYVRVFDKQEDMVYAYPFVYRGFLHVYKDGGIYGASAADEFMIYKVKFDKNKQEETIILNETSEENESGQIAKVWYVKGKKVTEEEFNKFRDEYWENNKDIPWSSSGIDSQLLQMELSKIPVQKKDKVIYNLDMKGDGMELSKNTTIAYYLCKDNENYCFVRYIPEYIKGIGNYSFEVFSLKEEGEELVDSEKVEFKTYADGKYDKNFSSTNMSFFRDSINKYLANSILLLSIEDGEVEYSTETKALTYQENYKKIIPTDIQNEEPYVDNQLEIIEEKILKESSK